MAKRKKQMIACNRCGKMFVNDGFVKCGKCVIEVFAEYNARLTPRALDLPNKPDYRCICGKPYQHEGICAPESASQ